MNKERDLLPWILGALSATAVAVAVTAVSSNKTAPPAPTAMIAAQSTPPLIAQSTAAPPAASVTTAPAPEPDPPAQPSTQQEQAAAEPPAPSSQIWECTTKGVKTFSNNPCGDKSTLMEVGPVNTMNPTPAVHYARAYMQEPRYAPAYAESDGSADQESYSDQVSAESGGNSYTIVQGVGFVARRRPQHPHHRPAPNHHNSGPMPRRY